MATDRQIVANRNNAKNSTGPRTEHGKRRSRRNAIRHGLTAETVIDVLEDPADYEALEAAINADYRPRTAFELELVARLVSLLWRLRRAVAIESGLMNIQAESLRKRNARNAPNSEHLDKNKLSVFYRLIPPLASEGQIGLDQQSGDSNGKSESVQAEHFAKPKIVRSDIARSFLRLANLDSAAFDRLGRYEMSLWRQTVQIILLLNSINRDANDRYADCNDKSLYLRNAPRKRRRILWPPFVPFA
jgi:hypothetical protein